MSYHHCSDDNLQQETERRYGFSTEYTPKDKLIEYLKQDDDGRGSDATTVETNKPLAHETDPGQKELSSKLVNQKIIYWTMNTFFASIQMFFESGLSFTVNCQQLPNVKLGLDPKLRFRITDCTHEEDGCITNSILPPNFRHATTGLTIEAAHISHRTSIALEMAPTNNPDHPVKPDAPAARFVTQKHAVFGLKLKGLKEMSYIWAKVEGSSREWTWADVSMGELQDDVPVPAAYHVELDDKPGAQRTVVVKNSLIGPTPKRKRPSL